MINSTSQPNRFSIIARKWFAKNGLSITSLILIIGLFSFEMFNYSTTDFALRDLLGDLKFLGIFWSTILAIAFCGIDFAGIARLFVSDDQIVDQKENWYLFGAWFLAATMNAVLTWWGVAISIANHSMKSSSIIDTSTINQIVPIFVAIMVWLTRILLIGSFSLKNKNRSNHPIRTSQDVRKPVNNHSSIPNIIQPVQMNKSSFRNSTNRPQNRVLNRQEPEYISDPGSTNSQPSYVAKSNHDVNSRRF